MNEEQKNIETCLPENILSEVANVPTDPQFVSLTDEALDPLKRQALRQAGYDGYEKVVWTHKPYTFTSSVKQMKSNLILLLRRLWRFPFGRGTTASSDAGSAVSYAGSAAASAAAPIRSLADMWQHYITRLKGNPEYGIPSRLSQLSDLPSTPALLADRKISGVPEAVDGISLARLCLDSYISETITELNDDSLPWELNINGGGSAMPAFMIWRTIFKSVKNLSLNISRLTWTNTYYYFNAFGGLTIDKLSLKYLESIYGGWADYFMSGGTYGEIDLSGLKDISVHTFMEGVNGSDDLLLPSLESFTWRGHDNASNSQNSNPTHFVRNCGFKRIIAEKMHSLYGNGGSFLQLNANLEEVRFGTLTLCNRDIVDSTSTKLLKISIGEGTAISFSLANWSPTLDDSNLQQFLQNFRDYIANRLTDKGTGLTITLSQEVRNAIHAAEDEYGIENIIITKKGWTISPAPN